MIGDGEQSRQHFVHGFLEQVDGIDHEHKVTMGIRDNRYEAQVPQVVDALRAARPRAPDRGADPARPHRRKPIKFTLPGPMTIVDTVADRHYGDRVAMAMAFAELLNEEALALQADGVDVVQFDEPAFNVYMKDAADWGVKALERATAGSDLHDGGPHLLRLRHQGERRLEADARRPVAPVRAGVPGARRRARSTRSASSATTRTCRRRSSSCSRGKDLMVGVIDVASDEIESPEQIVDTIAEVLEYAAPENVTDLMADDGQ